MVELASKLECPICARHVHTSPARPAKPYRARELGQIVAMDISYHTTPNQEKLMISHIIDEASRYRTAKILRRAACPNYSDLGNCGAKELIAAIQEWGPLYVTPVMFSCG